MLNLVKKITPHLNEEKIACSGYSGDLKEEIESLDSLEILSNDDKALGFNLVATSVNKICHHRYEEFFDYLIIDEVGQVPIITGLVMKVKPHWLPYPSFGMASTKKERISKSLERTKVKRAWNEPQKKKKKNLERTCHKHRTRCPLGYDRFGS